MEEQDNDCQLMQQVGKRWGVRPEKASEFHCVGLITVFIRYCASRFMKMLPRAVETADLRRALMPCERTGSTCAQDLLSKT